MGLSSSKLYRKLTSSEKDGQSLEEESETPETRPYGLRDLVIAVVLASTGTLALVLAMFWLYFATEKQHFVPNFPYNTEYVWRENDHFLFWPDWREQWDALMPHDGGFVEIPNPKQYGLSGGYPLNESVVVDDWSRRVKSQPTGTDAEAYGLSVFHQLHCLKMIQESYMDANINHITTGSKSSGFIHTMHCIDYLRQAVMCSADTSLEKVVVDPRTGRLGMIVDGWRNAHQCRNWDDVIRWVNEHGVTTGRGGWRLEDSKWVGKHGEGQVKDSW